MTLRDILLKFQPEDDENLDSPDGGGSGGGVVDPTIIPPPVIPKAVRPAPRAPMPPPATNAPIMAPDGNHPGVLGHLRDILNNAPGGRFNDTTTTGPDGQPQTVRMPTTTGSVMSAIGNLVRPAIAGAAHVNTAGGGPKDWFGAAAAGAQANQTHADKQKKLADDARAKQIEDFEIQRQTGTDARLQGAADEKAKHDEATAAEKAALDRENADGKSDANYLKATTEGGAKNADPEIAKFLDGKQGADYKTPDGFNRASYDKIGGRWLQFPGMTPKAAAQKATLTATLAKSGFKVDENGDTVPMTPEEMSALQRSTVGRNDAQAGNQKAQAALAVKRTSNEDRALDIRAQMANTAVRNAGTAEQRQALAKDKFGLDYTGQTADGSIVLRDPDTGQIIIPKVESTREKLPAAAQQKISQAGAMIDAGARLKQQATALAANGKMGAIAGTLPEIEAKIGTADPDVKEFIMGVKNMASLAPALHGARGVALMHDIEASLGTLRQNPEGFNAAINALQDTSNDLINQNSIIHRPGVPGSAPINQTPAAVQPPPPGPTGNPMARPAPAPVAAPPALIHDVAPPQPMNFGGQAGYMMIDPATQKPVKVKADRAKKYEAQGWKYSY